MKLNICENRIELSAVMTLRFDTFDGSPRIIHSGLVEIALPAILLDYIADAMSRGDYGQHDVGMVDGSEQEAKTVLDMEYDAIGMGYQSTTPCSIRIGGSEELDFDLD